MNSVFSAFKTNKSDKHSSSVSRSNGGNNSNSNNNGSNSSGNINNITTQKKLLNNGQENSYENLRHIREIGTSTKMMTSIIVNDDVEDDLLLHNRTILKTANLNENDGYIQPLPKSISAQQLLTTQSQNYSDDDDEVDHIFELDSTNLEMKLQEMKNEISMKRNLLNGSSGNNSNCCNNINGKIINTKNFNNCDKMNISSTTPAILSSSLSSTSLKLEDYDKNTSIQLKTSINIDEQQHQQINSHLQQPNSPDKSLSNTSISSSSSSASCSDVTTIVSSLANDNNTNSDSNNYNCNNGIIGNIFNGPVGIVCSAKPPNSTIPIIMANKNRNNNQQQQQMSSSSVITNTITTNSAATTPKATRYNKPRLSLSSFNNSNSSMPSVHGRSSIITNGTNNGGQPKRLSNHQRNLSLDFRSMGILLPPVSQVTNTRINLTQHHRNRSLDSALQRIPEVEVSSPNAEPESTFCTNSILGSTMCSKIVSSSTTEPPLSANLSESSSTVLSSSLTTTNSQNTPIIASSATENIKVEPCTRQNPIVTENSYHSTTTTTDHHHHQSVPNNKNIVENKKREDLTSLGSDDSGIICGSESDQVSLNRIRHSHESLDSGEMDPEEECIEILETTSMDEEYRMLQSDLCFYQTPEKDLRTLTTRPKPSSAEVATAENTDDDIEDISNNINKIKTNRIFPINIENDDDDEDCNNDNDDDDDTPKLNTLDSTQTTPQDEKPINIKLASAEQSVTTPTTVTKSNEILFKNFNFFGATKNVIFRTAQSIIENHEKKIAAKNHKTNVTDSINVGGGSVNNTITDLDIKSPTEISKKKEFFVLKSNSNKNKIAAAVTAVTITPQSQQNHSQPTTPEAPLPSPQFPIVTNSTTVITTPTSIITTCPILQSTSLVIVPAVTSPEIEIKSITKSNSISSLHKIRVPGVVKCFIREKEPAIAAGTTQLQQQQQQQTTSTKTEKGPSGLLRFFESPIFNIHFAIHYLFYSKEPGVLSFIGNKIFNFSNQEVDLYIPQLIVMYIQMDELAEVLDPYLTIRCRKSVDFSLKCLWLLEAYNYQFDTVSLSKDKKTNLSLMKELYSKKERKQLLKTNQQIQQVISPLAISGNNGIKTIKQYQTLQQPEINNDILSPIKKTHHRSQSDATGLLNDSSRQHYPTSMVTGVGGVTSSFNFKSKQQLVPSSTTIGTKLCLGDLTSGRAFDNGCICFESVRGTVNDLLGQKTVCYCGAPKTSPQKEFMKALINVGKNLTQYQTKAEKTSALRILLNLINKNLPARVWLPLHSDAIPHHIVRITEEKTAVLNSKDKTPYIIYVEVVEVNDIYTSPVILKMMPTLRHTKSEEHLETNCPHHNHHHHPQQQQQQQHHLNIMKKDSNNLLCNRNTGGGDNNICTGINKTGTKVSESSNNSDHGNNNIKDLNDIQNFTEDDVWSQEDDEITAQYLNLHKISERDAISQMSLDSCDSRDQGIPTVFNIGDVRTRHCNNLTCENTKPFSNDPEDPSAAALKEPWHEKERQIRESSPYGHLSNWQLLSAIVKCGDDLRQELMATQLLQMFKLIWEEENVDMWVRPYKIVCLSDDSGLIEPILNTVSLHQIKKNSNKSLKDYFIDEYGKPEGHKFQEAQKNFVQSCAAYCLISYLLQVKDRHNGNILLHSDGHLIHIDFGFILSISPKNLGFEQSPFKLTAEFVEVMGGTSSELWTEFNHLLLKGLMAARKHMDRIINLVEIMRSNAQLPCFKNGCSGTVQNLRKRFHMNLTEQELERKVEQLVQDSLKSLSTKLYDGYQYFTNGIL